MTSVPPPQSSGRLRLPRPRRLYSTAAGRGACRAARAEPIHWVDSAPGSGGGFDDERLLGWSPSTPTSRRCRGAATSSPAGRTARSRLAATEMTREDSRAAAHRHAQHGRAAPHPAAQDHLPRLHAARHRTAGGRARAARPEHRQDRGGRGYAATSSSRCRASCRCRRSRACSACRRRTATSCSAGPTR